MTSTLLQQAVEAPSDERILEIAHRTASRYTHRSDPTEHSYGFVKHTLLDFARKVLAESALQQQPQPVAWIPYLSDRADGVKGHYAICRWNPKGYREAWNLHSHRWAAYSEEVLTLEQANELLRGLTLPSAPPALQQQEEPREVAAENDAFNEWWESSGQGAEPLHTLTTENCARTTWHERARRAASLSPQDFTLPMVEEGKGTDGVEGRKP